MSTGRCQAPAEKTNNFKWFHNKAVKTLCLGAVQHSQSTSTHLSYSPCPRCHIFTEGQFVSNKQVLRVPGPALQAALAAMYNITLSVGASCGSKMMLCTGISSPIFERSKQALKAEANCLQATSFLWETPSPPRSIRVVGVDITLPAPQGRARDLSPANQGIPSPWTCDWFGVRHVPQEKPTDSPQGLAESAGKVLTPLPPEL